MVKLLRGAWNKDFLDEVEAFPFGPHDDVVDAASLALAKLGWIQTYESEGPCQLTPCREGGFW
ncbi:MAG TPA: hypothetical protein VKD72_25380 [Gemmataceae bacterium]|nr:hypothetical protein [Gemmataceae bacterium]